MVENMENIIIKNYSKGGWDGWYSGEYTLYHAIYENDVLVCAVSEYEQSASNDCSGCSKSSVITDEKTLSWLDNCIKKREQHIAEIAAAYTNDGLKGLEEFVAKTNKA